MKSAPTATHELSRRNLAKGAAWTIPVIAVAASAPASAASCAKQLSARYEVGWSDNTANSTSPNFVILLTNTGSDPIPAGTTLPIIWYQEEPGGYDQDLPIMTITRQQTTIADVPSTSNLTGTDDGPNENYVNKSQAAVFYPNRPERWQITVRRGDGMLTVAEAIPAGAQLRINAWASHAVNPALSSTTVTRTVSDECNSTLTITAPDAFVFNADDHLVPKDQYVPPTAAPETDD